MSKGTFLSRYWRGIKLKKEKDMGNIQIEIFKKPFKLLNLVRFSGKSKQFRKIAGM